MAILRIMIRTERPPLTSPPQAVMIMAKRFPSEEAPEAPDKEMINDRRIMPMTSSIMAALTIALPILLSSRPISFKVATVMETEVALRMTP